MIRLFSMVIQTRVLTLFLSEVILLAACFVAAAYADPDVGDGSIFLLYDSGISRIAVVVGFIVLGLFFRNLYADVRIRSRLALFQDLCVIFGVTFVGQGLLGYLNRGWIVPRKMMLPASILALAVLYGWRLLFDRSARYLVAASRVLFVGISPTVASISGHFAAHPEMGMIAMGYLESGTQPVSPPIDRLGTISDLDSLLDKSAPDSIVIGNRGCIQPWWADEFLALRFGGVLVQEAGTLYERIFARKCLTEIQPSDAIFGAAPQPGLMDAFQSLYSPIVALAVTLITLPLTAAIAVAIKAGSRGRLLTRETRVGRHDVPFEAYGFRCVGPDGAYTAVGRFLRRHRLVWLPQLLNVLKGEMAMVGPRPERPEFARRMDELIPMYRERHRVKPGLTGWARIHRRRGEAQDSLRDLEYDLYYLDHISPLVDFSILLLSLRMERAGGSGA